MRYNIRVDHIARHCVWRANGLAVCDTASPVPAALRERVETWMDRHIELLDRPADDQETFAAWLDYDEEGRRITQLLKPFFGPKIELFYYCEATDEYERVR